MNTIVVTIFAVIFAVCAAGPVLQVDITAQDNTAKFSPYNVFGDPFAASGDKIIHFSLSDPNNPTTSIAVISQVDNNGRFTQIVQEPVEVRTSQVFTNGQTWGVLGAEGPIVWELDASNNVTNRNNFRILGKILYLNILSDNVIVAQADNEIFSYHPISGNWIATTPIPYAGYVTRGIHANDNFMVTVNETGSIMVYSRSAQVDWVLADVLMTNLTIESFSGVFHNGADTIFLIFSTLPYDGSTGALEIFTKVDGDWIHQVFSAPDLNLTSGSQMGYGSAAIVNNDIFMMGSPYDDNKSSGQAGDFDSGSALLMLRQPDNTWAYGVKFTTEDKGLFGLASLKLDNYFAFVSYQQDKCQFYTVPKCPNPINATCLEITVENCDVNAIDLDAVQSYSLNDNCAASVNVTSVSQEGNVFTISLLFSRPFDTPYSCDAKVTCNPSSANPQAQNTPSPNNNSPSGNKKNGASTTSMAGAFVLLAIASLY